MKKQPKKTAGKRSSTKGSTFSGRGTSKGETSLRERYLFFGGISAVAALVGWGVWIGLHDPNAPPELSFPDLNKSLQAGYSENLVGTVYARNYGETESPEELELPTDPSRTPLGSEWRKIRPGRHPIYLRTIFFVPTKSSISITLNSSWTTYITGALVALEDAKREMKDSRRTVFWWLSYGDFRTRTHQSVEIETWARVRMKQSHIDVRTVDLGRSEILINRNLHGEGMISLMLGKAVYHKSDGKREDLPLRGIGHL